MIVNTPLISPVIRIGVPAVTKNAIDWVSRLPGESVPSRTTMGIVASTPGRYEANGVRTHLGASVEAIPDRLFSKSPGLRSIAQHITDGQLADAETRQRLSEWLTDFTTYIKGDRQ